MDESILNSIKLFKNIDLSDIDFDPQLIMHINAAFFILNDLGVGPPNIFSISDSTTTWSQFSNSDMIEGIKNFVYLKVFLAFDPPQSSVAMEALKQQASEYEWRLTNHR